MSSSTSTEQFQIDSTTSFGIGTLTDLLPDMETALFFGKVYNLDYAQLSTLMRKLFQSSVLEALQRGDHSTDLQGYIIDTVPPDVLKQAKPEYVQAPPPGEVLPELWASAQTEIAKSIKDVAEKLKGAVGLMPGKQGKMTFQHLMQLNKKRPTIGDYGAVIQHERQIPNLVILDDSGSMSHSTVSTILGDVVALSYQANAHLVLVSNTARHWEPGSYDVDSVLAAGEFGGTRYETLAPLLQQQWGTVVTIADYDSSRSAKDWIRTHANGAIEQVLDISLVDRPTYLSECVGQLAKNVQTLMVGNSYRVLY